MINLRLIQMAVRTLNDGLENHFFYMQNNANGVDECISTNMPWFQKRELNE